jgi:hypothetical protein
MRHYFESVQLLEHGEDAGDSLNVLVAILEGGLYGLSDLSSFRGIASAHQQKLHNTTHAWIAMYRVRQQGWKRQC